MHGKALALGVVGFLVLSRPAFAGVVKVEFSANVRSPKECPAPKFLPQPTVMRDSVLAASIAAPGTTVVGSFEYDTNAVVDKENNPRIGDRFSAPPNLFRFSLSIADRKAVSVEPPKAGYWISAAVLGRTLGPRWLSFGASIRPDPEKWPGDVDLVSFSLNLELPGTPLRGLPSASEFNSLGISGLSRFSLYGRRSGDDPHEGPLWIVCAELATLAASEEPAK